MSSNFTISALRNCEADMKILITGSQGYIGTFLTRFLSDNGLQVSGMDVGYYKDCNLTPVNDLISTKYIDIRDISIDDVMGFDAIIHQISDPQ